MLALFSTFDTKILPICAEDFYEVWLLILKSITFPLGNSIFFLISNFFFMWPYILWSGIMYSFHIKSWAVTTIYIKDSHSQWRKTSKFQLLRFENKIFCNIKRLPHFLYFEGQIHLYPFYLYFYAPFLLRQYLYHLSSVAHNASLNWVKHITISSIVIADSVIW